MCGLFASLSRHGPLTRDYTQQLDMLAHRGPDGAGSALVDLSGGVPDTDRNARAWLGHRRLSIIDPDPRANQPMATSDGRLVMVYNGEIYNYLELRTECLAAGWSFRTESDSEVLLACWALWGKACLTRLVGMFAFVVVDTVAGCAWVARDPFGIKPLHLAMGTDALLLSSELPPLLSTGAVLFELNAVQTLEYVRFGASSDTCGTLVQGVQKLPAASVARFDFATGTLGPAETYWQPASTHRAIRFADAVAECRERFLANVRLHLRSDVPVGAALSGGLDSSAIVCAVHHLEPALQLNTFSFISAEPGQSEEKWVDIVNAHIGAVAHKVVPQPDDLAADIDALVRAQGEPFGSASMYAQYRVFRMAREAGVPVMLDGQGADELLGGYWPHVATRGAALLRDRKLNGVWALLRHGADSNATRLHLAAQLAQAALPRSTIASFRKVIGRSVVPPFFDTGWLAASGISEQHVGADMIASFASLQEHLIDATMRTSLPTLLRIADRSSMAWSIESRVPFLTADFADFLFSLPPEHIVSGRGDRKHVFREAMTGILPEAIRTRRDKIGFAADDNIWLRHNRLCFEPHIETIRSLPMFDAERVTRYIRDFFERGTGSAQQVWRLFMFAIWHDNMRRLAG